jgi:hypothetical protein
MLLGWQKICSKFHESSEQKEFQYCEVWKIHLASREKELIFHESHQKERETLRESLL